jgi:hypothetical protein
VRCNLRAPATLRGDARQGGWGPVAPVWKGEERFSSNLGMAKLGGRSLERGNTATVLDKIQREGVDEWRVGRVFGASSVGGATEREKGEERGGGSGRGVPRGMGAVMGPGPDRRAVPRPCPGRP